MSLPNHINSKSNKICGREYLELPQTLESLDKSLKTRQKKYPKSIPLSFKTGQFEADFVIFWQLENSQKKPQPFEIQGLKLRKEW